MRKKKSETKRLKNSRFMGGQITNDAETIRKEKIISPDISKMEYRVNDPAMKLTIFFSTEKKYMDYLKKSSETEIEKIPNSGGRKSTIKN